MTLDSDRDTLVDIVTDLEADEAEHLLSDDDNMRRIVQPAATSVLAQNGVGVDWRPPPGPIQRVPPPTDRPISVVLDPIGPEFRLACGLVRRALLETSRRVIDRKRGNFSGTHHDELFEGISAQKSPPEPQASNTTLAELVVKFLADPTSDRATKAENRNLDLSVQP